ncbi:hypothetical protein IGI04_042685, partial [Brassica rapa subsp. trilocularis]
EEIGLAVKVKHLYLSSFAHTAHPDPFGIFPFPLTLQRNSTRLCALNNSASPLHGTGLRTLPFCLDEFPLGHCTISMASPASWKGRMDSSASHQSLHHRSRFDQFTFTLRLPRITPADDPFLWTGYVQWYYAMAISHCIINHTTLPVDYGLTCPSDDMQWHKTFVSTFLAVGELHVQSMRHIGVILIRIGINGLKPMYGSAIPLIMVQFNGQYHTLIGMIYEVLDREKRRTVGTALKQLEQRGFNQLSLTGAMETIHLIQIFFSQFCLCVISSLGSLIWCVISRSEALEYQEASHLSCVPHQSTNLDTDRVFDSLSKEKTISITFHPPTPPSSDPGRDSHSRAAPSDQPAYWSELPLKPAERRSVVPVLSLKQEEEKQQASILASPIQQIEESHKTEPEPTTLCLKLEEEAEVAEAECGHVPDQIKQEEKVPGGSSKALELVLPTVEQGDNFKSLACELLIRPLVCLQLSLVEHLRVVKGLQQVVFEPGGSLCVVRRNKQILDQKATAYKLNLQGSFTLEKQDLWSNLFKGRENGMIKTICRENEGESGGNTSFIRFITDQNKLRRDKQELVVVKEKPELEDEYGDQTTRPPDQKDVKLRVHGLMLMTRTWIGSSWREAFNCKLNKVEKSSALEATCSEESSKMLLRHEEGLQSFVFHPGETREYHTLIGMIYEVLDREKRRTVGTALKQLEQRGFNQLSLTGAMETIHLIQICMENKENMSGSFWIGLYLDLGEIGLFRSKKRVAARILIHLLSSWPNRTWRI